MPAFDTVYRDRDLLVVNKPAGVLSQASERGEEGLPEILARETGDAVYPVHRLDRETAGLLALARSDKAAASLSRAIREGAFRKEYLAVLLKDTMALFPELYYIEPVKCLRGGHEIRRLRRQTGMGRRAVILHEPAAVREPLFCRSSHIRIQLDGKDRASPFQQKPGKDPCPGTDIGDSRIFGKAFPLIQMINERFRIGRTAFGVSRCPAGKKRCVIHNERSCFHLAVLWLNGCYMDIIWLFYDVSDAG